MRKSRIFADIITGILTATSSVWVDVTVWHRIIIGLIVAFAMETVLVWIDEREAEDMSERIRENRENIIRNMK
jgi:Ni,Fe-hydrogenase I cytochrome b subunit